MAALDDTGPLKDDSLSTTRDQESWEAHTRSHLSKVRALRKELRKGKNQDSLDSTRSDLFGRSRPCGINTRELEDRLKRRVAKEQNIAEALVHQMESMEHTVFGVGQSLLELQRGCAALWSALSVADKRLELRSRRPAQEHIQDHFQDALGHERAELLEAHRQLSGQVKAGQEMRAAVEGARQELQQHRLTLHLDRTDWPRELLGRTRGLEEAARRFRDGAAGALARAEEASARARRATAASMKQRTAELVEVRRRLEEEIHEARCAIAESERELDRMSKTIKNHQNAPEQKLRGEELDFETLHSRAILEPGVLSRLRATIKGAAYIGHSGRQLDVLFGRFDRDGSGQLDEDEVRRALRRTLKIPPSVVTEPEISALCSMLDVDNSGSVSIMELVEFLNADVDIRALEAEYAAKKATLEQLNGALQELVENLRCKAAAWKIDDSCQKVTPVKGLELDSLPTLAKPSEQQVPKRKKPLEPRVVEKVRSKLNRAVYAGGGGEGRVAELFGRFDKDGSGQLDDAELRRAVRGTLKIPSYGVSDAEISSLCAMLDTDHSGVISISELVDFIGPEEVSSLHSTGNSTLEPINTVELDRAPGGSKSPAEQGSARRPKQGPRARP